ncbi:hypothetical protein [Flavobacterium sp. CLA17]|uniref:hypothetical protein n=1 Tax=Flavobacterium sp. CLA17 TaxID=2724135 RepID=UPI0019689057|nr:hypothetical protein [Flavobacterium sp. CLA17]QSB25386.1 hypothetical protein HAV12_013490 [Flavobacterium sp. CLA17]
MENKHPINVFNGLKYKSNTGFPNKTKPKSTLIAMQVYQNSQNIVKPFVKPISKII